jgi:RNA polymerase sigma-70 factor, ECF subfamily
MNLAVGTGEPQIERGEPTATLNLLYQRYWSDLVQYVNGMLSDAHQAEEIAQETMLRAWRNAEKLAPERGSVWGWLTTVARNITVDRIRYKRVRLTEVNESFAPPNLMVTADHSPDVINSIYVAKIVAQLPPAQREVLDMIYRHDRTCAEAAVILGIPVGTVKSRLHYALGHLRTILAADPSHHE